MNKERALALTQYITVREQSGNRVMIFCPSDQTEAGNYISAQELYLTKGQIETLAQWANPERDEYIEELETAVLVAIDKLNTHLSPATQAYADIMPRLKGVVRV